MFTQIFSLHAQRDYVLLEGENIIIFLLGQHIVLSHDKLKNGGRGTVPWQGHCNTGNTGDSLNIGSILHFLLYVQA
jgi:hypothetical protein